MEAIVKMKIELGNKHILSTISNTNVARTVIAAIHL